MLVHKIHSIHRATFWMTSRFPKIQNVFCNYLQLQPVPIKPKKNKGVIKYAQRSIHLEYNFTGISSKFVEATPSVTLQNQYQCWRKTVYRCTGMEHMVARSFESLVWMLLLGKCNVFKGGALSRTHWKHLTTWQWKYYWMQSHSSRWFGSGCKESL